MLKNMHETKPGPGGPAGSSCPDVCWMNVARANNPSPSCIIRMCIFQLKNRVITLQNTNCRKLSKNQFVLSYLQTTATADVYYGERATIFAINTILHLITKDD